MEYLDRLTEKYAQTFDITKDYRIGDLKADAYGYFFTCSEKYVLTPKANLWSIHGYEHIFFIQTDALSITDLEKARDLMAGEITSRLVCKGNRFPEKDHMYSYLTFAYLCKQTPDAQVAAAVERFRYEKDFLFTFRGHCEGHIVCMDLSTGKAIANRKAKHLISFYEELYKNRTATA